MSHARRPLILAVSWSAGTAVALAATLALGGCRPANGGRTGSDRSTGQGSAGSGARGGRASRGGASIGARNNGGGSNVDPGVGGAGVTFMQVAPILKRACAETCHHGRGNAADDFVFSEKEDLYQRMLEPPPRSVPVPCQGRPLVVPGLPDRSLLVAVLEEEAAPRADCAERMPHRCPERRPCLTAAEVGIIRSWIEAGARRR